MCIIIIGMWFNWSLINDLEVVILHMPARGAECTVIALYFDVRVYHVWLFF